MFTADIVIHARVDTQKKLSEKNDKVEALHKAVEKRKIAKIDCQEPQHLHNNQEMSTVKSSNPSKKWFPVFSHLKYEYLIAGVAGGTVSTLVLHPLDLIKVRFAGKSFEKD